MKQMETKPKDLYETPTVQDIRPVTTVQGDGITDPEEHDANDDGDD